MSSNLVQTGFFDLEEVRNSDPIQVAYDYSRVTPEQSDKLQAIYNRVLIRHVATAYEDGKDLLEARNIQGLPYKEFIAWAQGVFGWGESSIKNKMNVALSWGPITPTVGVIEDRAMYVLSTKDTPESARKEAKQRLTSGEDIDKEGAKEIRDRHKAEVSELEAKNKQLQTKFDFHKQYAQQQEELLNAKIDDLEQELATLSQPQTIIEEKHVIPPETLEHIQKLEAELKERTKERDGLSQLREQLSKELDEQRDANKARREQELYEHRINDRVRKSAEEWGKYSVTFLGQFPSPIESQVVTANNWALLDHAADMAQKIIDAVKQAKISKDAVFLNSEVPDASEHETLPA